MTTSGNAASVPGMDERAVCRFNDRKWCGGEVTYAADPFDAEIKGDETPVWECEEHRQQRKDDI